MPRDAGTGGRQWMRVSTWLVRSVVTRSDKRTGEAVIDGFAFAASALPRGDRSVGEPARPTWRPPAADETSHVPRSIAHRALPRLAPRHRTLHRTGLAGRFSSGCPSHSAVTRKRFGSRDARVGRVRDCAGAVLVVYTSVLDTRGEGQSRRTMNPSVSRSSAARTSTASNACPGAMAPGPR